MVIMVLIELGGLLCVGWSELVWNDDLISILSNYFSS